MNNFFKKLLVLPVLIFFFSCNAPCDNKNTIISIKTTLGDIKIKLYDDTPIHRNNFIKLINSKFYEDISFHRVIKDFMIQTGDLATKSVITKALPDSLNIYTIPSEFRKQYFHKKGALAAAREGDIVNPKMRSSGTQFYLVQGIRYTDNELTQIEQRINSNIKQSLFNKIIRETTDSINLSGNTLDDAKVQEIASLKMFQYLSSHDDYKFSEEQLTTYKNIGGVPRLDGTYTVFGEVIEGLDIVDKIASVKTNNSDKPINDIKIIKIKIAKN
jgi:cyclophilin family peptidyl-prolyl cis-trans isomerase